MENSVLTPLQYEDLKKSIINKLEGRVKIVPLNSLMHSKYRLTSPLHISLEYDDGEVIAGLHEIEAFTRAPTEYEALEQLCEEIVQIYEDISANPTELGPLPRKWLQYLNGVIECS